MSEQENKALGAVIDILLKNRPDVQKNPQAMEALNAIRTGDQAKGEEIAKAICQQNGTSPLQATNQAKGWFGGLFGNSK